MALNIKNNKNPINFSQLPTELKEEIFEYLIDGDKIRAGDYTYIWDTYSQIVMSVCRDWYNIALNIRLRKGYYKCRLTSLSIAISNLNIFKWAHQTQNLPPREDGSICYSATLYSKVDVLKHAMSIGYVCKPDALYGAIVNDGNLEIEKALYNNVEKYNKYIGMSTMHYVMQGNNLEFLKYLINEKNLHVNSSHVCVAVKNNCMDVLEFLCKQERKEYLDVITAQAIEYGTLDILELVVSYCISAIQINPGGGRERILGDYYKEMCINYINKDALVMLTNASLKYNIPIDFNRLITHLRSYFWVQGANANSIVSYLERVQEETVLRNGNY